MATKLIDLMTTPELVAVFNCFGKKPVQRFSDREKGITRILSIAGSIPGTDFLKAVQATTIRQSVISQFPTTLKPDANGASLLLTNVPTEESMKQKPSPRSDEPGTAPKKRVLAKPLRDHQARIMFGIQALCAGKSEPITSTELATHLQTRNVNFVATVCDQLARLKLITIEDDSPTDDTRFYYISITPLGIKLPCSAPLRDSKPLPNGSPGRVSRFREHCIFRLTEANPRREGTHGHRSFALIRDGMTFAEYKKAGGRNNDLSWDLKHGYVDLRPASSGATSPTPKKKGAKA